MKKMILICITFVVLQLLVISKTVVQRETVSDLEKKISSLRKKNQKLELQIANFASCSAIVQKAGEKGIDLVSLRTMDDYSVALRH